MPLLTDSNINTMPNPNTIVSPAPVPVRRYRYSRLRWRVLVHMIDGIGSVLTWCLRRLHQPNSNQPVNRILIVQLDHLGDAVLTTSMLSELRRNWPVAKIDVLASTANAEVFRASNEIHQVHVAERNWFERRSGCWSMLTAAWRLGRRMKLERYDLGIDVRGDILSIFLLVLAGIPKRAGWSMGGGGFWLTHVAEWVPGRHEVLSRLALLKALGIPLADDHPVKVNLAIGLVDRITVEQHLSRLWSPHQWLQACVRAAGGTATEFTAITPLIAPLVVVHPGAGTQAKRWPVTYWRRLIDSLRDEGFFVAMIGAEEDRPFSGMIRHRPGVIDLTGKLQLTETLALLDRSELFIGVDSGPAHLAAVTGTRSVILFSGTNRPAQWRPWSRQVLGLRRRTSCSPCHQKLCPLADHACMTGMTPEHVLNMSLRWWKRGRTQLHLIKTTADQQSAA